MKNIFRSIFLSFFVSCISFSAFASDPIYDDPSDDTAKDSTPTFPLYADVKMISTKEILYEKPRIVVKAIYPQLESFEQVDEVSRFNNLIKDILQFEIANFKDKVIQFKETNAFLAKSSKNDLDIDYAASVIKSGKNHLISLRFVFQENIAGENHPTYYHRVLNYNLTTEENIRLSDLFQPDSDYLTLFANYANNSLSKHLKNQSMITEGTAAKEENYLNWSIQPNGILITFDENKVAPSIQGAQIVLIPYTFLMNAISADAPIIKCVQNPKTCRRNNILTGGFIDQA